MKGFVENVADKGREDDAERPEDDSVKSKSVNPHHDRPTHYPRVTVRNLVVQREIHDPTQIHKVRQEDGNRTDRTSSEDPEFQEGRNRDDPARREGKHSENTARDR